MKRALEDGPAALSDSDRRAVLYDAASMHELHARVWRLEEAVRRITALPAAVLGLHDRGLIGVGRPADLFLFDPDGIDVGTCRQETDAVTRAGTWKILPPSPFPAFRDMVFATAGFGRIARGGIA